MKPAERLTKFIVCICLIILIGFAAAAGIWYQHTDPLVNDGMSTFATPDGKLLEYVVDIENHGFRKIDLVSVSINGPSRPGPVQLGISYDSGHIVQVLAEPDPAIEYMDIDDSSIYPVLSTADLGRRLRRRPIHLFITDFVLPLIRDRFIALRLNINT